LTAILTSSTTPLEAIRAYVGIVVSPGEMVDAPHSGAVVRIESYSWADYLGATRPAGTQP